MPRWYLRYTASECPVSIFKLFLISMSVPETRHALNKLDNNDFIVTYIVFSSHGQKDHVSYCHHLASDVSPSSSVCKLFQKSSSLKPLNQFEPHLDTIIIRVSCLKNVSDVPSDEPTWLSLLKIEHRGKINKKFN